mmetsp:Transcript_18923/g.27844  ORF Transcript_18923/g.27844 Transcript_18923/m.27844 type:complete len:158 (+) Transcript_18923:56-529(+)|eukprot:CAMPEP_0179448320 /NCGR_PEP_ID=MMETSP0799-20121207/32178_1 /TAXON_ID=46947 /ORGANISM="Geminigera cryophila, Strain CCMP2564" /LENGTH=157 /DNA_ID=CAMNT_0021240069 /DNA_START=548 /DNA_END=1021 /DNA_ORIENTATION=-
MPVQQQSGLQQSGITIKDVDAHEFVKRYAVHLKKQGKISLPELVDLMKTSVSRELAPYDEDWFYIRCASLARRLYVRQGTGVGSFSKVYGAKKRRGTLPGHFCRASRGVIRNCLKQLQKVGVLEAMPEGKKGGRRVTKQGQQDCDRIAKEIWESKQN